jgi:hypothetical protein
MVDTAWKMGTSSPIANQDGLYRIRRWRAADGSLQAIDGHEELYDEEDMYRRLNRLRRTGETYVRDKPWMARLIQP